MCYSKHEMLMLPEKENPRGKNIFVWSAGRISSPLINKLSYEHGRFCTVVKNKNYKNQLKTIITQTRCKVNNKVIRIARKFWTWVSLHDWYYVNNDPVHSLWGSSFKSLCDLKLGHRALLKGLETIARSQSPLSSSLEKVRLVTCLLYFCRFQRCDWREGLES